MKGNLIWSMRTQRAMFIEDEGGKFEIVDGQIEPIIKEKVVIVDREVAVNRSDNNSELLHTINRKLRKIEDQTYKRRELHWDSLDDPY